MRAGKGGDVIRDVVGQLAVYAQTHFLQEEVLMKQTGYPGLPAHQQQHASLMADVEKYKSALNAGKNLDTVAILDCLRSWLVDHIQKIGQCLLGPHERIRRSLNARSNPAKRAAPKGRHAVQFCV